MTLLNRTRFGLLDLHFGVRAGKTVLLRDMQKAPLMVVRPFTLPCGTLMAFIVNPTGGVLGGDHSEIRVQVDGGARVLLLTQSATRIQPSPTGETALQNISFHVQDGARLEYYPERTIPFAGSGFRQHIQVQLQPGAEFGMTESLAAGRVQNGERLAFRHYQSTICIERGGQRTYLERQVITPDSGVLHAPGVWAEMNYVSSGVWVAPDPPATLTLSDQTERFLISGWSRGNALWLRAAAESSVTLDHTVRTATQFLRCQLFRAEPLQVRR